MKKIFAFILASLMVLSLVPASAFAAVTNCPKTHTVNVCDSLGISYSQVGKPVAPSCLSAGYTVYECDECGEQFVGNFVEKAGHKWVSDTKNAHKNVKADCTTQKDGTSYVICSVCNEADVLTIKWNHKDAHKLSPVAGSGIGCEARSRCSLCGAEGYLDEDGMLSNVAAHKWEFVKVLEEPVWNKGKAEKGLAQYKCTVCGDTKDVDILAPKCEHLNLTLVLEAVEATCDTVGSIALYKCDDCAKYFTVDEDGDLVEFKEDVNKDGVVNEDDGLVVIEHEVDPEADVVVDGCDITYTCKNCEKTFTEKNHVNPILSDVKGYGTCVSPMYKVWICVACTETWVETTDTSADHEVVEFIVPATCHAVGYKGTYCKTEGRILEEDLPATWVLGKDYYAVKEVVGEDPATAVKKNVYYKVVSYNVIPVDYNNHVVGTYVDGQWVNKADYEAPACSPKGTTSVVIWECKDGCTSYGFVPEYIVSAGHSFRTYGTISNTTGSDWTVEFTAVVKSTVKSSVKITKNKTFTLQECVNCGLINKKSEANAPSTTRVFDSEGKAKEYHGYLKQTKYKGNKANSATDGTKYVAVGRTISKFDTSDGVLNCLSTGYGEYTCKCHSETFYAKTSAGAHVEKAGSWVPEKPATCTTTGTKGYWTCELCGVKFRYKGYDFNIGDPDNGKYGDDQEVLSSLVINKHASSVVKVTSTECTGISYWLCLGEDCGAKFTDATAATAFTADVHTWVTAKSGVPATCNADGTLQIRWCSKCKILEINALYLAADGKVIVDELLESGTTHTAKKTYTFDDPYRKIEVAADGKTANDKTATLTSFTVAKFDHKAPVEDFYYYEYNEETKQYVKVPFSVGDDMVVLFDSQNADDNHTTAQYDRWMCVVCDYEYLNNYVAATGGHINRNGEILTTDCDNQAITDRVCVKCPEGNNKIEIAHVQSDIVNVEANCSVAGYTYWYCLTPGCGYRHVDGSLEIDPDNHVAVDYGFEANYAHEGQKFTKCALCGKVIDEASSIPAPKVAGLEITLSTDYESYMPGSIVNVTVSLESLLGVDVWAVRFPVNYDPTVYQYVGATNVGAEFATANAVFTQNAVLINDVITDKNGQPTAIANEKVAAGIVNVVANAEENVYVKGSYDLVTLQFKVIATEIVAEGPEATDTSFTVAEAEVSDVVKLIYNTMFQAYVPQYKDTTYSIEVVNEKAKAVKAMYGDEENSVAPVLYSFLDLDMDGDLTLADAKAIYALITDTDAEYNVLADADADGAITIADLNALYQIFTGASSVEEVLTPEAPEDETSEDKDRVIIYDADGYVTYDSKYDLNNDGKLSAGEIAYMTGSAADHFVPGN